MDQIRFYVNSESSLQASMRQVVLGVGGLDHSEWRAFTNEHSFRSSPAHNFIDGDLVEQFLELRKEGMQKVRSSTFSCLQVR